MQTLGARFAHGLVTLEDAADLGCRACASPGGGCQFLGTAATSQVVAEALGLTVPHAALAPSGQPIWLDVARRTAAGGARPVAATGARSATCSRTRRSRTRCWSTRPSAARRTCSSTSPRSPTRPACRRPTRRGLAPRQPCRAASRRRAPERPAEPPDGARLPRRRRSRGDAPPAPARAPATATRGRCSAGRWDDVLDEWEASERRARLRDACSTRPTVSTRRRHLAARPRPREGHDLDRVLPGRQPGPGRQRHQGDRDRPPRARRGRRLPADRPGARLHERAGLRSRRIKGTGGEPIEPGDVIVLAGPRAAGHRDGGDLPAHVGAQVPPVRPRGRARHRRALLGRLDRRLHRPREPGGARGRTDRPAPRRRPSSASSSTRSGSRPPSTSSATATEEWAPEEAARVLAERPVRDDVAPDPRAAGGHGALGDACSRSSGGLWGGCVYDQEAILRVLDDSSVHTPHDASVVRG